MGRSRRGLGHQAELGGALAWRQQGKGRRKKQWEKTVAILVCQFTNMGKKKKMRGEGGADPAAAKQLVRVEEVVKVWDTPITEERKNWTTQYFEKKLWEKHEGQLTQGAAVALTQRDRNMERMVDAKGLKMRALDLAWAWVAQKIQDGQAVGEVYRPELGPLRTPQVLWQLQAQALTGRNTLVREKVTREVLRRVVLSRKVLQSMYRVTDKEKAMRVGGGAAWHGS